MIHGVEEDQPFFIPILFLLEKQVDSDWAKFLLVAKFDPPVSIYVATSIIYFEHPSSMMKAIHR